MVIEDLQAVMDKYFAKSLGTLLSALWSLRVKVPSAQENRENGQKKHREFGNFVKTQGKLREFCQNTGNFVSSNGKYSYS